jgi:hypothetical protein
MSIGKRIATLTAFLVSAAGTFVLAAPTDAGAFNTRTTAGITCRLRLDTVGGWTYATYDCPVHVGSDFETANLSAIYVDTDTTANTSGASNQVVATKVSFTGTYETDSLDLPNTSTGLNDYGVTANKIKLNPSVWDYLYVEVTLVAVAGDINANSSLLLGVSAEGS